MLEPEYIPFPGPGEFCVGTWHDGLTNTCCLMGWVNVAFLGAPYIGSPHITRGPGLSSYEARDAFTHALLDVIWEKFGKTSILDFNDSPLTTDKMRAAVWKEAARRRGYQECR